MDLFTLVGTISIDIEKAMNNIQSVMTEVGELEKQLNGTNAQTQTTTEGVEKAVTQAAGTTTKKTSETLSSFKIFLGNIATQAANEAFNMGKKFAQSGFVWLRNLEMWEASFKTHLGGSEEAAEAFMKKLQQFAIDTPLSMADVAREATNLFGAGFAEKDIIPALWQIGDLSKGNSEVFTRVARAYWQGAGKPHLNMQDANQMVEVGVPIWQIIADYFNATERDGKTDWTKDFVSNLGTWSKEIPGFEHEMVTNEEFRNAIAMATSETGDFYNAMNNLMDTEYGQAQKMLDAYTIMSGNVMRGIFEVFKGDTIPALNEIIQKLDEWAMSNPEALTNLGQAFSDFATGGLKLLTDGLMELLTFWNTNRAAFDSFLVLLGGIALYTKHPAAGVALIGTGAADLYNAASRNAEEDLPGLGSEEDTLDEMGASDELRNAVNSGDFSNVSDEEYSKYKSKKLINSIMVKAYGLEEEFAKTADSVVSLVSGEASTGASDLVNSVGDAMNYKRLLERYNPDAIEGFSFSTLLNGLMNDPDFFINKWRKIEVDPEEEDRGGGRRFGQPSIELPEGTDGVGGSNSIPALIAAVQALTAENQSAPDKMANAITAGLSGVSYTTNVTMGDVLLDGVSVGRMTAPHVDKYLGHAGQVALRS